MEVKQAEAFLAVAQELHFGRAAEHLNMAQPPLSRIIKQLERELRAELFIRSTRSVELTVVGKALIEPAQRIISASKEALKTVEDTVAGRIGHVRIGFAGASTYSSIGRIFQELRDTKPGITLDVESSMFSPEGLRSVLDQESDLAIGRWDYLPAELDSHLMAQEEVIVALPPSHALADSENILMKDLAQDSWVSLPLSSGSALQNRLTHLAVNAGFVPRITQTAPDSWAQLVLVGVESGCAITLNSVRKNLPDLGVKFARIIDAPNPPLEVRLIWRKDNQTPAVRAIVDIAQELYPVPELH